MSSVEARIRQWFIVLRQNRHPLLTGDPAGEPVLRELVNDPSPHVQALARIGMQNLEAKRNVAPTGS